MDTRVGATVRAHKLRTLETIRRAADLTGNAGNGAHWRAREAPAQADSELRFRARRNRQEPVFSLRGMENALNRYLQKKDKGPATPLGRLASAADAAESAARLPTCGAGGRAGSGTADPGTGDGSGQGRRSGDSGGGGGRVDRQGPGKVGRCNARGHTETSRIGVPGSERRSGAVNYVGRHRSQIDWKEARPNRDRPKVGRDNTT